LRQFSLPGVPAADMLLRRAEVPISASVKTLIEIRLKHSNGDTALVSDCQS
jgi:hypothetical protein